MNSKITEFSELINSALYTYFDSYNKGYETLVDSMRYSVKNGGKRVRPLLTLLFCDACGGDVKKALPLAVAVEYIHTYSLIHDDLPCMDNDDFRRGKPSNHKVYGEAFALLAGDGLLTAAFDIISNSCENGILSAEVAVEAIQILAHRSGSNGMIGGQVVDLMNEKRDDVDFDALLLMDTLKTGALISAACMLGCVAADAKLERKLDAEEFGRKIGLAFQIKDDILDVTSNFEKLGKLTGSDEQNEKSTYVKLFGVERCQELVDQLTKDAMSALEFFENNEALIEYAEYLSKRDY